MGKLTVSSALNALDKAFICTTLFDTHKKTSTPFGKILGRARIQYAGRTGMLIWDHLAFHELTFVDEESGLEYSLGVSRDKQTTNGVFDFLVEKYGVYSNGISIREYQSADAEILSDIIVKTWGFSAFSSNPKAVRSFGHLYLNDCLVRCSKTYVAIDDNKPVGIIIGTDIRNKGLEKSALVKIITHAVSCITDPELVKAALRWREYGEINDNMDRIVQKEADGEITLFIVSSECRGKGVGKKLYSKLMEYFRSVGISNTYVHTDTACSYEFYESQGMTISLRAKTKLSYADVTDIEIFVLTGDTSEKGR